MTHSCRRHFVKVSFSCVHRRCSRTMMTKRIILLILRLTIFPMLGFSVSIFPSGNKLKQFFNTNQPIWTVNTTIGRKQWITITMDGTFKKPDAMVVFRTDTVRAKYLQRLLHHDKRRHCAVIAVASLSSDHGTKTYDLRMWNSSVHRGPSMECLRVFFNVERRGHAIYDRACQNIYQRTSALRPHVEGKTHEGKVSRGNDSLPEGYRNGCPRWNSLGKKIIL
uniref:Lipocalin n=1 Tax=Rhipicephalus appendiculatus TaxID=34631 RepID=A0A131YSG8_RHIAP